MLDVHDRGNPLSLTVILPTYNAITHLEEMLDSLRLQTLQPDEVRIFDDCSTDDTVKAIEDYIKHYKLDNWFLYKNERNKGWIKNFMDATRSVKNADVILFADQDDIWHRSKLKIIEQAMLEHPDIGVLSHRRKNFKDRELTLSAVTNLPEIQYSEKKLSIYKIRGASFITFDNPGCTLAIRKNFAQKVDDYCFNGCMYDLFYCSVSAILGKLWIYDEELLYQRTHSSNTTHRGKDSHNFAYQLSNLDFKEQCLDMLYNLGKNEGSSMIHKIARAKEFSAVRRSLYVNKKLTDTIKLLGYLDCYPYFRSYVQDVMLVLAEKLKLGGLLENVVKRFYQQ